MPIVLPKVMKVACTPKRRPRMSQSDLNPSIAYVLARRSHPVAEIDLGNGDVARLIAGRRQAGLDRRRIRRVSVL